MLDVPGLQHAAGLGVVVGVNKELAKDDDIVILPADKGRATVVMDRKDYSAKMLTMLGDRDTYQLMAKDPTTSLENRMNSVLLRLQEKTAFLARPTTTFVALQLVSHVSMGCPRSTSLMSLSAQLYPLCPHPRMRSPSFLPPCCHQLSAFLTPT